MAKIGALLPMAIGKLHVQNVCLHTLGAQNRTEQKVPSPVVPVNVGERRAMAAFFRRFRP